MDLHNGTQPHTRYTADPSPAAFSGPGRFAYAHEIKAERRLGGNTVKVLIFQRKWRTHRPSNIKLGSMIESRIL